MEIKLGEETILLRATFENVSDMESNVGGLSYLAFKFSRGTSLETSVKSMPSLTDIAKIIYFNQAARNPEDPTKRKFSLEEIWDLVQAEGVAVTTPVVTYLALITKGNKNAPTLTEEEKKS